MRIPDRDMRVCLPRWKFAGTEEQGRVDAANVEKIMTKCPYCRVRVKG